MMIDYKQWGHVIWRHTLTRFLLVGLSNTFISFLFFHLAFYLLFGPYRALLAQGISYFAGCLWSYYWNRRWTFQSTANVTNESIKFFGVQISLLMLSSLALHYMVDIRQLHASLSWIAVMVVITIINYLANKIMVFR